MLIAPAKGMATESARRRSFPGPAPAGGQPPRKQTPARQLRRAARALPRALLWLVVAFVGLAVLVIIASFFVDEPMRRSMEKKINNRLTGYSVQIPRLHFSLFTLSVTLSDVNIYQQAHPDPPVAFLPRLRASVQWGELLSGHIVSDFLFDKPRIHINLPQLRKEAADPTPMKDHGWQQAAEAIYPFKINLLRVNDGDFVYIDEDSKRPLHVAHLNLRANNIRNIHSKNRVYPSPVHAEGVIFETGRGVVDGHADFLAEPFAGIHVLYRVSSVPLDNLRSLTARANLTLKGGVLESDGEVEYAPKVKFVQIKELKVSGLHVDYIHTLQTAAAENARKEKVGRAAKKVSNKPDVVLRLDRFDLVKSDLGLVNKAKTPPYRLFLTDANLHVTNLSNHFSQGPAVAKLRGRFMGSGPAVATATFRPAKNGPDFEVDVAIEDTQMTSMNDMLRAYGKLDVAAGLFSFYSQLRIKNGEINGYVKPLFTGVKVYDPEQDKEKSFFHKLYEMIVGGVAKLLENRQTKETATRANISGKVGVASASIWEVIGKAFENAFIKAILPGFDREAASQLKKKG
jgi:hypothetical protein